MSKTPSGRVCPSSNSCASYWKDRGEHVVCHYCGSMSVSEAVFLLGEPGTQFSGCDWKHGWPHKFYIDNREFYNAHLRDCSPELFEKFSRLSEEIFGIAWSTDAQGVKWRAVPGTQKWGKIGEDRRPEFLGARHA